MSQSTSRNFDKEYKPKPLKIPRNHDLRELQFWNYHLAHCDWLKDLGGIWYGKEKGILE